MGVIMNRYQTKLWQFLKDPSIKRSPEFARHLRDEARPDQIAFSKIMTVFNGQPVGIEFRHRERRGWAFVLPNVSSPDPWRIQYFDADGFSGHECHRELVDAVEDVVRSGYWFPDKGKLDELSATTQWIRGVKMLDLLLKVNTGQLSWEEANRMAASF